MSVLVTGEAAQAKAGELHTLGLRLDVLDRESIKSAAETTERELGPLQAWISNAGVSTMARFTELTEQDWDQNMDVNAKGVFLCGQEAARRLRHNGGGAIVNTASMAGKRGGAPFLAHYVASKFAVAGLTQALELHWEPELRGVTVEEVKRLYVADTPLGRLETPEDVAAAVLFLASPASSPRSGLIRATDVKRACLSLYAMARGPFAIGNTQRRARLGLRRCAVKSGMRRIGHPHGRPCGGSGAVPESSVAERLLIVRSPVLLSAASGALLQGSAAHDRQPPAPAGHRAGHGHGGHRGALAPRSAGQQASARERPSKRCPLRAGRDGATSLETQVTSAHQVASRVLAGARPAAGGH